MTTTINAVSGTGLTQTSDGSGIVKLQSNGVATNALAWVNFGYISSAITIRSSYNVSSVTRNGTGDYTINFANATSDANYAVIALANFSNTRGDTVSNHNVWTVGHAGTTLAAYVSTCSATQYYDMQTVSAAIFGN